MKDRILIVEDDQLIRESLHEVLVQYGYDVQSAPDGATSMKLLAVQPVHVALLDLRLPDMTGIQLLRQMKESYPSIDCIMVTSFATVESSVQAMKLGAADYLTKPINDDELKILLNKILDNQKLRSENERLKNELAGKVDHFHNVVGEHPSMQKIYHIIRAVSQTDATVLLRGESGTGKGMLAQAIHDVDPKRKQGPYVEVSCGAIPRELVESELFGHVKGAFTTAIRERIGRFELAHGGTILLDEIDTLALHLQVKLLRILQHKTFERVGDSKTRYTDVRIIAATNRNLEEEIVKGNFREDLYYRLNVVGIDIPPLRERKSDIPGLARHFIKIFNQKMGRSVKGVTKEAMDALVTYDWPGNVRELENMLERVLVLLPDDLITYQELPENLKKKNFLMKNISQNSLKASLQMPEKDIILKTLEQAGWNRKKAATLLNINRTTLYNKMKKYDLLS